MIKYLILSSILLNCTNINTMHNIKNKIFKNALIDNKLVLTYRYFCNHKVDIKDVEKKFINACFEAGFGPINCEINIDNRNQISFFVYSNSICAWLCIDTADKKIGIIVNSKNVEIVCESMRDLFNRFLVGIVHG